MITLNIDDKHIIFEDFKEGSVSIYCKSQIYNNHINIYNYEHVFTGYRVLFSGENISKLNYFYKRIFGSSNIEFSNLQELTEHLQTFFDKINKVKYFC